MPLPSSLRTVLWIALSSALLAGLYVCAENPSRLGEEAIRLFLHGALIGCLIGGSLSALDLLIWRRAEGGALRRLPLLATLGLRSIVYLAIIILVQVVINHILPGPHHEFGPITFADIVFSLTLAVAYNLLLGINALLGPGVLFSFVAGRYHHPRMEERALLFIDLRSSTAAAELLGDVRFLDLLNRFVFDVSLAIADAGGKIHKYVGDEVIATWRLKPGVNEADCVRACFAALERLAAAGPAYEREFGFRADFRAALHCGSVAVGELGHLKKEIALIGDAMNTAARILDACRAAEVRVLASAALIGRIGALPTGVVKRALGPLPLRGKEHLVEIVALEPARPGAERTTPAPARYIDPASTM